MTFSLVTVSIQNELPAFLYLATVDRSELWILKSSGMAANVIFIGGYTGYLNFVCRVLCFVSRF